jgi:exodeoxyribonuclease V alpha subunit
VTISRRPAGGRLHPRGAVRAALSPMPDDIFRRLARGAAAFDLGDEQLYLAEELLSMYPFVSDGAAQRTAFALMVLAVLAAERQGSTCLPIDDISSGGSPLRALLKDIASVAGVDISATQLVKTIRYISEGHLGTMFGMGAARAPLVVDLGGLYTERARWLEHRVASGLRRRFATSSTAVSAQALRTVADVLARPSGMTLSAEQAAAVQRACEGGLTMITGGPGTGKTAIATAIVRAFAALDPRPIVLAAPTGKAAQRLGEVIGNAIAHVSSPNDAENALIAQPLSASTLHRLFGVGSGKYGAAVTAPLTPSVLIVDESSMIDLEMMATLLEGLSPDSALVLLGDSHQLPAVNAGQILADLSALALNVQSPHSRRVVTLTHSFRMDARDPDGAAVLAAAQAVDEGEIRKLVDGKARLASLRANAAALTMRGVEWVETAGQDSRLTPVLAAAWRRMLVRGEDQNLVLQSMHWMDGQLAQADAVHLDQIFDARAACKILTVTKGQSTGAEMINQRCHEFASSVWRVGASGWSSRFLHGEPVMMIANDYSRGLWNGDQGIVAKIALSDAESAEPAEVPLRAWFKVKQQWTPFALETLADRLQPAWAMTVHKSQGSEMTCAVIVLPVTDSPLMTKELIYTAITRAKKSAILVGPKSSILSAKRGVLRYSKLIERIVAEDPT